MHTFFINTSGKDLGNYKELLEVQQEIRQLVWLDCPLQSWLDPDTGVEECVRHMGEMIDSYGELSNRFNLIVYVDLLQCKQFASLPMESHRARYACLKAMHTLYTHYLNATLLEALGRCGREPEQTLVIFEESSKPADGEHDRTEDGRQLQRSWLCKIMGMPEQEALEQAVKALGQIPEEAEAELLLGQLKSLAGQTRLPGILEQYPEQWALFLRECRNQETVQIPLERFLDRIQEQYRREEQVLHPVSFVTDRAKGSTNKQARAKRDLQLAFYILQCVQNRSLLIDGTDGAGRTVPVARPMPEMEGKWDMVVAALEAKAEIYRKKHTATANLAEGYTSLNLAPELYDFDHDRFGMDAFGEKAVEHLILDEEQKKAQPAHEDAPKENGENRKQLHTREKDVASLLTPEEFAPFDYSGDDRMPEPKAGATEEEYIHRAKALCAHHMDYLKKLKVHITNTLSNYAGRSEENDPPVLKKRTVSLAQAELEDTARSYPYAKGGRPREKQKLNTVRDRAEAAYHTAQAEYLKFCAGRSVALTGMQQQCDWFLTRIYQIAASLKKIRAVALGLLVAIAVLYVPFLVIQWSAITASYTALAIALASIGIPAVLLYGVFTVVSLLQRRQFLVKWREFKDASDQILSGNREAVEKYDRLLSVFVPTLRWVYEYKLDVEFYQDCCRLARAKVAHHAQKMQERLVSIGNILEDMEWDAPGQPVSLNLPEEVDFNVSFCSGQTNQDFYSIADPALVEQILV